MQENNKGFCSIREIGIKYPANTFYYNGTKKYIWC